MLKVIRYLFGAKMKENSVTPPSANVTSRLAAQVELECKTDAARKLSEKDTKMKMARILSKL